MPVRSGGGTMVGVRHEKTAPYAAGDVLDVIVGEPVHGGWCVARPGAPEAAAQAGGPGNPGQAGRGPVLFIRHTLPRERVKAAITPTTAQVARPDAVAVAPAAGDRAVMVPGRHGTPRFLTQRAAGRDWRVSATGFWQVHPGAADALADAVLAALRPEPGETALDLFCGAGLFAGVLASAVGPDGRVIAVEQDAAAVGDAKYNLRLAPRAEVHRGDAAAGLHRHWPSGVAIPRAR